jgi:hypothetical protein
MSYAKVAADAGDQYLTALAEIQENFLKSATAFAERVAAATPPVPAVSQPAFAPTLPTAQEVTEANFAFAQKLLKQQKSFAEKLLAAGTPASK